MGARVASVGEALAAAMDMQQAGRLDDAALIYDRVRDAAPELPEAHYLAGLLAAGRGDFSRAVPALAQAVALRPAVPALRLAWAQALQAAGDAPAALAQFQAVAAMESAPLDERVQAAAAHARLCHAQGALDAALAGFTLWAALAPDDPAPLVDGGHCALLLDRWEEALTAYARALALLGPLPGGDAVLRQAAVSGLIRLGACLLDAGRWQAAAQAATLALDGGGQPPAARLVLAQAQAAQGQDDQAVATLAPLAAALDGAVPGDGAQERLAAAELLWRLHERHGRPAQAVAALRAALALAPGRADLLVGLGMQLRELGAGGDALAAYDAALATGALDAAWTRVVEANRAALLVQQGRGAHAASALPSVRLIVPGRGERGQADCHNLARLLADIAAHDPAAWDDLGRLLADIVRHGPERGYFWKTAYYVALETGNHLWRAGRGGDLPALMAAVATHARPAEPLPPTAPDGSPSDAPRLDAPRLDAWWDFLDGCVALRLGDGAGARAAFARAGQGGLAFAPQVPLGDDWARAAATAAPLRSPFDARLTWLAEAPGTPAEPVVLVAADGAYVRRYLPLLAASLALHAPAARLHVHLVDPDPSDGAALSAVAAAHPGLRLGVSTETMDPGVGVHSRAAFLTAVRFLRLPALLARYGADMVVADIDAAFLSDPAAFTQALDDAHPLAATYSPDTLAAPYDAVGAGLLVLRAGAPAAAFAGAVRDFLLAHLDAAERGVAPLGYFIDQVALSAAMAAAVGTGALTPRVLVRPVGGRALTLGAGAYVQILQEKNDPGLTAALAETVAALRRGDGGALARFFQQSGI